MKLYRALIACLVVSMSNAAFASTLICDGIFCGLRPGVHTTAPTTPSTDAGAQIQAIRAITQSGTQSNKTAQSAKK